MANMMIVDDAAFMRFILRQMVESAGHTVVCEAQSGLEAIDKYATFRPDLVTMDITMPGMDGIAALREIVRRYPGARIVVCTAVGQRHLVVDAIQAGALDYLIKPVTDSRVLEAIDKALSGVSAVIEKRPALP